MNDAAPDVGAPVHGCVVLAHGLNTTPAVMDGLAAVLRQQGYSCAHVVLHPLPAGRQKPDDVVEGWLRAFDEAYDRLTASHPGLPVFAVGYSLGGLVALLRASQPPLRPLQQLVLWAPPLSLTRSAAAVRLLTPAHRLGLGLPSAAPREGRARSATPLAEYAALLRMVDEAAALPPRDLARTSTLVLLAPRDPLVSRTGVTGWVEERRLASWTVEEVGGRETAHRYRHLVVSEAVLGRVGWERATAMMLEHLALPRGGGPATSSS